MRISFFRHGKAVKADPNQSDLDRVLSAVGQEQARALRKKLGGRKFDLVLSSPAWRAVHTAVLVTGDEIGLVPELYPDPKDGGVGTEIDRLANLPHLGYCEVARYLNEEGGDVVTDWGRSVWESVKDKEINAEYTDIAIFGHAVCLQALGMAACEDNPGLVEKIGMINLGECEGFVVTFDEDANPESVELV